MSFLSSCPTGVVFIFAGSVAPEGWLLCDGTPISRTTYAALFSVIGVTHGNGDGSTSFHLPDYRGRMLRGVSGATSNDPDRTARTQMNAGGNTGNAVGSVQGQATAKNGLAATVSGTNTASAVTGITGSNSSSTIASLSLGTETANHTHTDSGHGHNIDPNVVVTGSGGVYPTLTPNAVLLNEAQFAGKRPVSTGNASLGNQSANHSHNLISGSVNAQSWSQTGSGSAAAQPWSGSVTVGAGDAETRPINAYVNYIIKI